MSALIILSLALGFAVYGFVLHRWIFKDLTPLSRWLVVGLLAVHVVLLVLHSIGRGTDPFINWYLNYKYGEFNPAATYSTIQFWLVALTAGAIALFARPRRYAPYWIAVTVLFGFLAADEYFAIHEKISNWIYIYGGIGAALVIATGLVYLSQRANLRSYALLIGGLGVAMAGAGGIEVITAAQCFGLSFIPCADTPIIEEFLENTGILTSLIGAMLYAQAHIPAWRRAHRSVIAVSAGTAVVLLAAWWVVPSLELRAFGHPVHVAYTNAGLNIVGYSVSRPTLTPGDSFDLNIYWQRAGSSVRDAGLSAHLVDRVSGIAIAGRNKFILGPQPHEAPLNTVMRTSMNIAVPPDAAAPASYWLTVTTWQQNHDDYTMKLVSDTDRPLLSPDSPVLQSLTVLNPAQDFSTVQPIRYDFADGISLAGFNYEQSTNELMLEFLWETRADIKREFVQFVHLLNANGELILGIDQPPFASSFPTTDWPGGLRARDVLTLALPDDIAPGEYHLYTGMYSAEDAERQPVTDSSGQPVTDNYIDLAGVMIQS